MIPHDFLPDSWGRDQCDRRIDDDGQVRACMRPRAEHEPAPDEQPQNPEGDQPPPPRAA